MALDILGLLVAGAGASYGWWALQRHRHARLGRKELESAFDGDTAVVFTVAAHAMTSRGHSQMWSLHLLYGLLQDETFTGAIKRLDGDPDAIETTVLGELDARKEDPTGTQELIEIINRSYRIAQATERKISIKDLWLRLAHSNAAPLVGVDAHELAFLLVHERRQPALDMPDRTDVHVVLRNDDHTPMEFVVWLLRDVFELSDADSHARMMETHTQGRAVVGRYKVTVARDKVISVRSKAREQGFPLWIGLEDC